MTSFFSKRLLINLAVIAGAIGANVSVAYAVALVGPARAPLLLIVAITPGSGALIHLFGVRESAARVKLRVARAVRRSDERFRELFDTHPVPTWIFDRETLRFLAVNAAALEQYGYAESEFLAMTIRDIRLP